MSLRCRCALSTRVLVSDQIIIDTIVSKYADHSPLYRQSAICCATPVGISRTTMCGWVMRVGELLEPVVGVMRKELHGGWMSIQADETPVDVQTHDKRGQNHQAYLWQYGTPGGDGFFDFRY